jgi:hypothetical protein
VSDQVVDELFFYGPFQVQIGIKNTFLMSQRPYKQLSAW